jgi:hypothetical protein
MFNLTLRDHLNLTFTEIIQRHNAHAAKAQTRARWSRRLRGSEAMLVGGAAITSIGAAFGHGQALAIAAACMAGLALLVLLISLTFDLDASARAHAISGAQLWGLRERYRSLLSDLHDGALGVEAARLKRDQLIEELRSIYDTTSVIALEDDRPKTPDVPADGVAPKPPAYRSA